MTPSRVRVAGVGDNVVDRYEALGTTFPGGNCVNVAVFAARAGAAAAYVGAVGQDADGLLIRDALVAEGVDVSRLRVAGGPTAHCRIGHRGGDRVFLGSKLGVSVFDPDPADLDLLSTVDAAHVGHSSRLDRHLPEIAGRTRLSYDFAVHQDPQHIRVIAPHCYLATFSGGHLAAAGVDAVRRLAVASGAQWVLVTRGAAGAVLSNGSAEWHCPASPAASVVDTLGGGDAFIARTLVGLLAGEAPDHLLAAAASDAAAVCTIHGAFGHGRADHPVLSPSVTQ
ncbi:PfkB family carbohydrate kinase [Modestobacter marinus]|uniref:PfkB family carbohydrate kinase n=1 Tax=Modestobacter marinus TaxID=477641 RepID=UPI00201AF156|nr:PfkB family carbohydrate kinase [Modestobacter marinus]